MRFDRRRRPSDSAGPRVVDERNVIADVLDGVAVPTNEAPEA
jgi:hypothetical protein